MDSRQYGRSHTTSIPTKKEDIEFDFSEIDFSKEISYFNHEKEDRELPKLNYDFHRTNAYNTQHNMDTFQSNHAEIIKRNYWYFIYENNFYKGK